MHEAPSYFVCTLPRSGSWLLCQALTATGVAGRPEEYFWDELRPAYAKRWGLPPAVGDARFIGAAIEAGSTANGVFAAKVHWFELRQLLRRLRRSLGAAPAVDLLNHFFPDLRFVHLVRDDRIRQAVSYHLALATQQWWLADGTSQVNGFGPQSVDYAEIDAIVTMLERHHIQWGQFFVDAAIEPFVISYDDLCASTDDAVAGVLDFLGLPPPQLTAKPTLRKQADERTEEIVREYIRLRRTRRLPSPGLYGLSPAARSSNLALPL